MNGHSNFADLGAGVYIIYEKGKVVYVGETGNLFGRMKDLRRTVNHSFRRRLGYAISRKKATSKEKFSLEVETQLNEYCIVNIKVTCMEINLGRKEIEEYITEKD